MPRKIAVACDHAAFPTKVMVVNELRSMVDEFEVEDLGPSSPDKVDYPDYAALVAERVVSGEAEKGILLCGTGIGMSIAANKVHGIRAGLCHDHFTAKMTRSHNDANILCIGAWTTGSAVVKEIVETFLHTDYEGGDNAPRLAKIAKMEQR